MDADDGDNDDGCADGEDGADNVGDPLPSALRHPLVDTILKIGLAMAGLIFSCVARVMATAREGNNQQQRSKLQMMLPSFPSDPGRHHVSRPTVFPTDGIPARQRRK